MYNISINTSEKSICIHFSEVRAILSNRPWSYDPCCCFFRSSMTALAPRASSSLILARWGYLLPRAHKPPPWQTLSPRFASCSMSLSAPVHWRTLRQCVVPACRVSASSVANLALSAVTISTGSNSLFWNFCTSTRNRAMTFSLKRTITSFNTSEKFSSKTALKYGRVKSDSSLSVFTCQMPRP